MAKWSSDFEVLRAGELDALRARVAALETALRRIVDPAPAVTETAPPWVIGIARAALKGDSHD